MDSFSSQIIAWYAKNCRDLPWRNTKEPYQIWVSEIILQQTRVDQGLPYYFRFLEKFKNIYALAAADEDDLLKIWQGLGYYSRARNMHKCAKYIVTHFKGVFPNTYKDLLCLPGIGPYTAAAIASFCFDEKIAVVDGNVSRLVARYLGILYPVNEKIGFNLINDYVNESIANVPAAIFNQAMMEMGAIVCKPKLAKCHLCCLQQSCFALKNTKVDFLPIKIKKIKPKPRYFHYFILGGELQYIYKRVGLGIWEGLYEFSMKESATNQVLQDGLFLFEIKHILTHQVIHAKIYQISQSELENLKNNLIFEVYFDDLKKYPKHQLMHKIIKKWQELIK